MEKFTIQTTLYPSRNTNQTYCSIQGYTKKVAKWVYFRKKQNLFAYLPLENSTYVPK